MEAKFAAEMEEHKVRLDKEYDAVKQNFVTELEKLRKKQAAEIDKKVRGFVSICTLNPFSTYNSIHK